MGTKTGVWAAALLIASGAGLLAWQQSKKPSKSVPPAITANAQTDVPASADVSPAPEPTHSEASAAVPEHAEDSAVDHSLSSASPTPVVAPPETSQRSFRPKDPPVVEPAHTTLFPEPVAAAPSAVTPPPVEPPTVSLSPSLADAVPAPTSIKETPVVHMATPPATAPAEATKVVSHVVVLGETYSSIAQKYYGSAKYTNLLVKANPGKDPRKLQPGNKLVIPEGPKREASATPKEVMPDVSNERPHTPTASSPPVAADRAYTVKPGETWNVLARRFLGDSKRWPELYELNVDRAPRDPDGLRSGTVIELPAGIKPTTNPS